MVRPWWGNGEAVVRNGGAALVALEGATCALRWVATAREEVLVGVLFKVLIHVG